jgi:hypothetical protein
VKVSGSSATGTARGFAEQRQIVAVVHLQQFVVGHPPRLDDVGSSGTQVRGHAEQYFVAADALGMPGWGDVIGKAGRGEHSQAHGAMISS